MADGKAVGEFGWEAAGSPGAVGELFARLAEWLVDEWLAVEW